MDEEKSCYQLLSKVVISCYHVNTTKNELLSVVIKSCFQLLSVAIICSYIFSLDFSEVT